MADLPGKFAGQILLIICCVFYIIWWSVSYRPDVSVNRVGGINGLLLLITAACGLGGVALGIHGINSLPGTDAAKLNGGAIVIAGIAAYVVLLLTTRFLFSRSVTTELVLITGWMVLEFSVINAVNAAGELSDTRFYISCVVIAIAVIISLVLYVLYYRMEPMKAFYAAMVPLVTEAMSMAVVAVMIMVR